MSSVVTIEERTTGITISVVETGARDTSEWSTLAGVGNTVIVKGQALANGKSYQIPRTGRIVQYQADRTAGTGTTIQPRLGKAAAWSDSTMAAIGGQSAAADFVNDATPLRYAYAPGEAAILYGRSTPNSASTDHAISTLIVIARD